MDGETNVNIGGGRPTKGINQRGKLKGRNGKYPGKVGGEIDGNL